MAVVITVAASVVTTVAVLDIVAVTLLSFHDAVDDARGAILTVVLLSLAMALVDVAAGATVTVEVGVEVAVLGTIRLRVIR
jgi:hypothetical protein